MIGQHSVALDPVLGDHFSKGTGSEHVALIPRISGHSAPQQLPTDGPFNLLSLTLLSSLELKLRKEGDKQMPHLAMCVTTHN